MKRSPYILVSASSRGGFTLLELLTSMTILLIMVGFLAVTFNAASTAWQQGEKDVDRYAQARATIDLIARDLRQAIVTTNLPFYASTNCLAFVAPINDDRNSADLAEIVYIAQQAPAPYTLYRRLTLPTNTQWQVYSNPGGWPQFCANSNLVCDT